MSVPKILEVLMATVMRKPVGSATEIQSLNAELANASPARAVAVATYLG